MARYPGNKMRNMKPIKERLTVPWGISINEKDFEKLKTGHESFDMDGQWDVLVESPDKNNNSIFSVHFVRSWTGHDIYILHLNNSDPKSGIKVDSITWEGNKNGVRIDAEQAQKEVVLLARDLLKCEFDELPHYDFDEVDSITWEGNKNGVRIDAEQAQKEVVLLARDLLKCEFDELPHYDFDEVYNHPAYFIKRGQQKKASS
ncbi:hypothetical protein PspLS_07036 [Pyricularia sp. CBS 133598]|nr:hypothetical protein PspLS_07036 [Pyricularia sp. CBS 133598]